MLGRVFAKKEAKKPNSHEQVAKVTSVQEEEHFERVLILHWLSATEINPMNAMRKSSGHSLADR
jgi:hypothetical protein